MPLASEIEKVISDFTSIKIGERIYLDFATENVIVLRPLCSRGSTSLGSFWVRVLQHGNNYPVYSYPYKTLYNASKRNELQLRVDGMDLVIDLSNGCMTIKGIHVIDWFVTNFPDLMDRYSSPHAQFSKQLREHFSKEETLNLQAERQKMLDKYFKEWPIEALEHSAKVMKAGEENQYYEIICNDGFLFGQDVETHSHMPELLNEVDTKEQLVKLGEGSFIQGTVMYRLWKSTLNLWLADDGAKVYIITPFMDSRRLTDICDIFLKNRLTACIDTVCVCFGNLQQRFSDARKEAISRFPAQDQVLIEYKIYNNIVYPTLEFSSSFIAMVKDGKAHILQTNSNFDSFHFQTIKATSASYSEISENHFHKYYMDPLIA